MKDLFEEITDLIRAHRDKEALGLLLRADGKIAAKFCTDHSDSNHAQYIVADIFYRCGKYLQAIRFFNQALVSVPEDQQAVWALGDCYSDIGLPSLAEKYYRRALVHGNRKDRPHLLYNIANALFDQREYRSATRLYKQISGKHQSVFRLTKRNMLLCRKQLFSE